MALTVIGLIFAITGCTPTDTKTLTVSVASSLTVPMQEQLSLFATQHPSYKVFLNLGSSGALAQQILNGAETDLFISANQKWITKLEERGLVSPDRVLDFLGNELVVIVPQDSGPESFAAFLESESGTLAVGAFESVPVGEYTKAWLQNTNQLSRLNQRLVFLKNEQQVLHAVESQHASAGVVYRSSLNHSEKVRVLLAPSPSSYPAIRYSAGIVVGSNHTEWAHALLEFLKTPESQNIWIENGFQVVE